MKFLIISNELIGSAICHRLINEGADVKLCVINPNYKNCLDGIIPKSLDWEHDLSWVGTDGIIVFDDVGFGSLAENLRKKGFHVVGGTSRSDKLEVERAYFQKILHQNGILTLESYDFETATKAIDYINKYPSKWVVKHTDHLGTNLYVGEMPDGSDTIEVLKTYSKNHFSAHLQKRAEGVEVAIGRYFNGNTWIGPICINFEHKRLCDGDLGPLTPEMGTISYFTDEEVPFYQKTLERLDKYLRKVNFIGYFDINCIVNDDGIWPLEATSRFGTPMTELHMEMLLSPLTDFLVALASGTDCKPKFYDNYGIVVSIAVPPFPFHLKDFSAESPLARERQIFFSPELKDSDLEHIHFEEVVKRDQSYYWSGPSGWVMHVTDKAHSISEARDSVYSKIQKIIIPQMFYRTDIGKDIEDLSIPYLKKKKYI